MSDGLGHSEAFSDLPPPPAVDGEGLITGDPLTPRKPNWKKIGTIGGGVFVAAVLVGVLAIGSSSSTKDEAISAPVTTTKPSTTVAPTTAAPTTTLDLSTLNPTTTRSSAAPSARPAAPNTPALPPAPTNSETPSQSNARQKAASYLSYSAFSRSGLIRQLEYEGFSTSDATYGTDAQNANWNEQAALKAASYLSYSSFSRSGLISQLVYEGFTQSQAEYGVNTTGL